MKNSYPYVVRATTNNGVKGYIVADENNLNPGNTLSFAQDTFTVYYQKEKYYTGNKVKVLFPKISISDESMRFIMSSIQYAISNYGWGDGSTVESISNIKINLPQINNHINIEFMECFVAELEAQRVAELEAYLTVTGLKDYELTADEEKALENFEELEWHKFKMSDLFERIKTKRLPYKAKELPQEPRGKYVLPCLTSSFMNQGLNYYAPIENATILKNVISLPSNSDVYRAYYQSRDFTVLSDAYAIKWIYKDLDLTNNQYLFSVVSINQVTDLPIYSYKNKLGGWNIVKNKFILLPVQRNDEIDFRYMDTFITAIKKLVIKEVVKWTDKKIELTKDVVNTDYNNQ